MRLPDIPAATKWPAPRFPTLTLVIPVILGVAMSLVFRSPYALMIAVLGPMMALSSWWEARRSHRAQLAQDQAATEAEQASREQREYDRDEQFRREQLSRYPCVEQWVSNPLWRPATATAPTIRVGLDRIARPDATHSGQTRLVSGVPRTLEVLTGIAVVGDGALAQAVYRAVAIQCVALWAHHHPEGASGWLWPDSQDVPAELTLSGGSGLALQWVGHSRKVDPAIRQVIVVAGPHQQLLIDGVRVDAALRADTLSAPAALWALRHIRQWLPDDARREVSVDTDDRGALWCRVDESHWHNLVTEGPHALVWGQSGRGKTALLHRLISDLAGRYSPEQFSCVVVDFKGGAGALALQHLPHLAGVLTDLEPESVRRVQLGLQAEISRRERLLATHRVADLTELASEVSCARTIVAIDEVALLLEREPSWATLLGDIASRGRSLGLHLVVSGQRITAQVPRSVIVNAGLRWCLGVTEPQEAREYLPGVSEATVVDLQSRPPGHVLGLALGATAYTTAVTPPAEPASPEGEKLAPVAVGLWAPALPEDLSAQPGRLAIAEDAEGQCLRPLDVAALGSGLVLMVGDRDSGVDQAARWSGQCVADTFGATERLVLPECPAMLWEALGVLVAWCDAGAAIPAHITTPRLDGLFAGLSDHAVGALIERLVRLADVLAERGQSRLVVPSRPGLRELRTLTRHSSLVVGFSIAQCAHWEDLGLPRDRQIVSAAAGRALWGTDFVQWVVSHTSTNQPTSPDSPLLSRPRWSELWQHHPGMLVVSDGLPEPLVDQARSDPSHGGAMTSDRAAMARPEVERAITGPGVIVGALSPSLLRSVLGHEYAPPLAPPDGYAWWVRAQQTRLLMLECEEQGA